MDKNIRGRWSQYQILSTNEIIKSYLLKTELLNEHSLHKNLHHQLTFRPCFGHKEINICKIEGSDDQYSVLDGNNQVINTLIGNTEVLHYLNEVIKTDQSFILQDTDFLYNKYDQIVELVVTVQRDLNSIWHVTDIDKKGLKNIKIMGLTLKKIYEVVIETALYLVENKPEYSTVVLEIGLLVEQMWIRNIELHSSKSKWSQYQILSSIDELASYLPNTQLATPYNFFHFIQKHKQVMLKPCHGQWGIGVVQVSLLKDDVFEVHNVRTLFILEGKNEIINHLQTHYFSKETYIVQERVNLAKIVDSIFDARVMVQREVSNREWEITAKVAKVAAKNFIVTNVAKSILLLEEALEKSTIENKFNKALSKIDEVCMICALNLGEHFLGVTRIGIDIGIDKQGNIWILETNLVPDVSLFKRLQDKSIYEKVISIKKH